MGITEAFFRDLVYYPVAGIQAGPVRKYLDSLMHTQFAPREELLDLQARRFARLLAHSRHHVPFYAGRIPVESSTLDSLADLPFLQKTDLQDHAQNLTSASDVGRLVSKTTGGSNCLMSCKSASILACSSKANSLLCLTASASTGGYKSVLFTAKVA